PAARTIACPVRFPAGRGATWPAAAGGQHARRPHAPPPAAAQSARCASCLPPATGPPPVPKRRTCPGRDRRSAPPAGGRGRWQPAAAPPRPGAAPRWPKGAAPPAAALRACLAAAAAGYPVPHDRPRPAGLPPAPVPGGAGNGPSPPRGRAAPPQSEHAPGQGTVPSAPAAVSAALATRRRPVRRWPLPPHPDQSRRRHRPPATAAPGPTAARPCRPRRPSYLPAPPRPARHSPQAGQPRPGSRPLQPAPSPAPPPAAAPGAAGWLPPAPAAAAPPVLCPPGTMPIVCRYPLSLSLLAQLLPTPALTRMIRQPLPALARRRPCAPATQVHAPSRNVVLASQGDRAGAEFRLPAARAGFLQSPTNRAGAIRFDGLSRCDEDPKHASVSL